MGQHGAVVRELTLKLGVERLNPVNFSIAFSHLQNEGDSVVTISSGYFEK